VYQRYLLPLTWETAGFSNTAVFVYGTAWHHIPDNSNLHSPCHESGFNYYYDDDDDVVVV
jgi:hypothetical protein